MNNHEKNVKAALAFLGAKEVLELVQKDMVQRSRDACNDHAEAKWWDASYRLTKIIEKL